MNLTAIIDAVLQLSAAGLETRLHAAAQAFVISLITVVLTAYLITRRRGS